MSTLHPAAVAVAARPPFWRYAAKALVALAVGVVAAGGVILAAVADDHVSTSEWVTIVLSVLGAIVGPTAVYAIPNATRRQPLAEVDWKAEADFLRTQEGEDTLERPEGS